MTLNDALSAIQTAGLTVTVRGVNVDGELNTVIDQNPAAGASVPPGTTISLSVATGNVPVPNVVGMPREQAQRVLQEQSFRLAPSTIRRDPRLPQGAVIETRPGAGSVVPRGTAVELVISTGP
jgi:serine/threonine-protein kinase